MTDRVRSLFEVAASRQDDVDARQWRASVRAALFGTSPDPVRVGRYTILERLGSGGAGTVFAAWDPKLERRVAVKLLHDSADSAAHQASEREARLLAQLNHPNVVAVYDVSSHLGQPMLAMEYVAGPTVGQWAGGPSVQRTWRDVVEVFAQAARGLAAAHAAGIIHGDLKPSNMLVGPPDPSSKNSSGRVRVSDFGIARLVEDNATPVSGTPLYTAPELFNGSRPDVRSDAFSFFAALFEALYGRPAFDGSRRSEVVVAICTGQRRAPPPGVTPRWLTDLVRAGLSQHPAERPADFVRVAAQLERRGSSSRRWGVALGVVAATTAIAPLFLESSARADDCRDGLADVQTSWNQQAQRRIEQHWTASGKPDANETWTRVSRSLDAYVVDFREATGEVCDSNLDPEAKLQGELCLRWREQDFTALVDELGSPSGDVVDHATLALQALRTPSGCLPIEGPLARDDEAGPAVRLHVQRLVSRARVVRGLGRSDEARAHLDRALAVAQSADATRLQAETLLELGRERAHRIGITQDGPTEMTLEAARQAAASAGDRQLAGRAALELADAYMRSADFERARAWLERASSEIADSRDPVDRGRVELLVGLLLSFDGKTDEALSYMRSAIALLEEKPAGAAWLGRAFNNFGELRFDRGEYSEAQALYERGLQVWEDALGPAHPYVADILGNLGETVLLGGGHGEAVEHFARALEIRTVTDGEDSFVVAHTRAHLGDALRMAGRHEEAAEAYRRTLRSAEQLRGELTASPEGRVAFLDLDMGLDQVEPWAHHGLALIALGRAAPEEALAHAHAAPLVSLRSGRHADLAGRRDVLGLALLANGRPADAIESLERAEATVTIAFGAQCVKSAYVPYALGLAHLERGDHQAAADALHRARAIAEADAAATVELAQIDSALLVAARRLD